MRRLRLVLILLAAVTAAGLALAGLAVRWFRPIVEPPTWADEYEVTAQQPEEIAPGTVVGSEPPLGWSHLVIKSLPRIRPADVPRVPDFVGSRDEIVQYVSWMFTAFVADVVPEQHGAHTRYRLRAIALGLGATVNGRDTILTVETAERWGQKLNFARKKILTTGYQVQRQSRIVVHGPSFALVDTPVSFRCGEKNRMVRFRYALLVDPATGRLDVITWRLGDGSGECADLTRAVLLNPNTIDVAELIPDVSAFIGGVVPDERTFGVDDLPPHRLEIKLPTEVVALGDKMKFAPEEAHRLETDLRKLLPR